MSKANSIVPQLKIEQRILFVRGEKVIIDADLADFYGVPTKRLNEQVKRNKKRFPEDFMFQLTADEKSEVVAKCDHLAKLKYSKAFPRRKLKPCLALMSLCLLTANLNSAFPIPNSTFN